MPTRGKRVLLNVGSTGTRKGTRNLLEALAHGKKYGLIPADVELWIVGSQKPSSKQEARDIVFRAMQPDIRDSVRLVGIIEPEAIESYYDEADIYVHASYFDCMPIAILSAMARGMPIVATDVDGCREAIIDGETGMLAPPRSPRQLAEAIGKLLANDALREKVGCGARNRFVELFSVEASFDLVRQVLDEEPLREPSHEHAANCSQTSLREVN
jgi:glycosyltransferase involved in cell wall biosynthesis